MSKQIIVRDTETGEEQNFGTFEHLTFHQEVGTVTTHGPVDAEGNSIQSIAPNGHHRLRLRAWKGYEHKGEFVKHEKVFLAKG